MKRTVRIFRIMLTLAKKRKGTYMVLALIPNVRKKQKNKHQLRKKCCKIQAEVDKTSRKCIFFLRDKNSRRYSFFKKHLLAEKNFYRNW